MARAAAALDGLDSSAALDLRERLLEKAGDWAGATVLLRRSAESLPPQGPIDATQAALVLRLASAATQAGDDAILADVREHILPRLPAGPDTEMIRLLTASPIRMPADLPRARREATLAEQVLRAPQP